MWRKKWVRIFNISKSNKLKIITLNPLGAMTKLLATFTMWPLECVKSFLLLYTKIFVKTPDQQQDNKTQSKTAYDYVNQNYRYNTKQHHTSVINAIKEQIHWTNAQIIFLQNLFNRNLNKSTSNHNLISF